MGSIRGLRRDDSGIAIVVALLVTLVSFIIVTAVLAQATHNISQSGYSRRRLSAISAAEAGLNWYWKTLEQTTLDSLRATPWTKNGAVWEYVGADVASGPDAPLFQLRVRYLKENPCAVPGTSGPSPSPTARACSESGIDEQLLTEDPFPAVIYAVVRSIGCAGGTTDCWGPTSPGVRRALETVMRLRTSYAGVSGAVTASYLCLDQAANLQMYGDLYVMGAPMTGPTGWPTDCGTGVVVGSGDGLSMTGNLYAAQGNLVIGDNVGGGTNLDPHPVYIKGDVWARGAVALGDGNSGVAGSCDTTVKICVEGNVVGSSVTVGPKAFVMGDTMQCNPECPPPVLDFPKIVWDPNDWAIWQIVEVASGDVPGLLANPLSRTVYHVSDAGCVIDLSGTFTINVDIAVVGECRFEMNSSTTFRGSGALRLMSVWPGSPGSPGVLNGSDCGGDGTGDGTNGNGFRPGSRDIYMHNNPDTSGPALFLYTPCSLKIDNNQNPVKGQLVARFLWIKNQATVTVQNLSGGTVPLPGLVSGFSQDVRYINEITVAAALV